MTPPGTSLGSRAWRIPWHPMLFAASVVLAYWLDVVVSPHAAFRSLLIGVAGAGLLTLLLWPVLRSPQRAGIATSAVIGLFFSKHLLEVATDVQASAPIWLFAIWILAVAGAVALIARLLIRTVLEWRAERMNRALNVAGVLYVASTIGLALITGKLAYAFEDLAQGIPLGESETATAASNDSPAAPDMYLILLDGYPRADALAEAFDYDAGPFIRDLAERGFTVTTESHSDYIWTQQSLTSMLHMTYVEQIPRFRAVLEERVPQHPTLREIVNDNPAFDLARDRGYQVVATGYGFDQVALRQADVYVDGGHMNEFELKLLVSTFLGDVLALVAPDLASGQHRDEIEHTFESLVEIAAGRASEPRLIFGHIAAPHQPTVFGRNGEPVVVPISRYFYADSPQERREPAAGFVQRYRDQLGYLNQRVIETIDGIRAASDQPPVIVLWADHGSASRIDWTVTSPEEADPALLAERTATLFAALTPGRSNVYPNDITPASIFRFLADAYFDTDYGPAVRLADSDGVSPDNLPSADRLEE